ncbi:hypothetical protein ACXPVS_23875 [Pseudomonas sp. Ma2-10]
MAEREYRTLQGMALEFVSGVLEEDQFERTISYSAAFDMTLGFAHFVQRANAYIPGCLSGAINVIRPELDGFSYHHNHNYFSDAAGNIGDNQALIHICSPLRLSPLTSLRAGRGHARPTFSRKFHDRCGKRCTVGPPYQSR